MTEPTDTEAAPARVSAKVRKAHLAIGVAFTVNGMLMGSWAPRIPEVQQHLGIGHGHLGLTLFALAVGSLIAMPAAGWAMVRTGSGRVLAIAAIAACLLPGAVGLAASAAALWPILFVWGAALGAMDVAMNAQAVTVQRHHPRSVINGIHACFSLGGLIGAGVGTAAAILSIPLGWHLALVGIACLLGYTMSMRYGLTESSASGRPAPPPEPVSRTGAVGSVGRLPILGAMAVLCAASFAAMLAEGAATDWSAVRLTEAGAATETAGLGYAAFALTMLLGRVLGDHVAQRIGHERMVAFAALCGCAGTVLGFFLDGPFPLMAAFASLGIGLSCLMPYLFLAAGEKGRVSAAAVTAISTSGYVGMLVGPALIGLLAELSDVASALWLLPALLFLGCLPALKGLTKTKVEKDGGHSYVP